MITVGWTPKTKSLYQGAASYITTEGWEADCKAKVHIAALAVFLVFALLSIFFSCSSSVSKMLGQMDQISVSGKMMKLISSMESEGSAIRSPLNICLGLEC